MKIALLTEAELNSVIAHEISELFGQLSPQKQPLPIAQVVHVDNPIHLAYAEAGGRIIGMASLCTYRVLSGYKGWIEDVVVHADARGKGAGKQLIQKLLEVARDKKLTEILLFTETHRKPAIQLYHNLGFTRKNSELYSFKPY
ncbi:GNAT family N-acetyltransferase [Flavobacteriaceae bacterium 3-367]|uniref:GNAT family N-acetyltransferase n=1 Tax=Eudoraea algarum TaxID=3417568 RepID=UPI003279AE6D